MLIHRINLQTSTSPSTMEISLTAPGLRIPKPENYKKKILVLSWPGVNFWCKAEGCLHNFVLEGHPKKGILVLP